MDVFKILEGSADRHGLTYSLPDEMEIELQARVDRLTDALQDIINHQRLVVGDMAEMSTVTRMAQSALDGVQ